MKALIWINSTSRRFSSGANCEKQGRFVSESILQRLIAEGKAYAIEKESIKLEPIVHYFFTTTI